MLYGIYGMVSDFDERRSKKLFAFAVHSALPRTLREGKHGFVEIRIARFLNER